MKITRRFTPRTARITITVIILASICLRLGFVSTLKNELYWPDPRYYDDIAWRLASAQPMGQAVMRAPMQGFLLVLPYAIAGHSYRAAYIFQALLAGLIPLLLFLIGVRLKGYLVGLIAAGLSAIYPYYVYISGALYATQTSTILLLLVVYLAVRANQAKGLGVLLLQGVALGGLVLTRSISLALVPVAVAWTWPRRGLTRGLLVALVALATVAPWTVHNYLATGEFIPVSVGGGREFLLGISPGATGSSQSRTALPDEVAAARPSMGKMEWDRFCYSEGLRYAKADPGRFAKLYGAKFLNLYRFYPNTMTSNEFTSTKTNLIAALSYGPILVLAIVGIWLERRRWVDYLPPLGAVAVFSLMYPLFTTCVRYRLPIDAYLILFAAVALGALIQRRARAEVGP
jgi:4-amino-4-deoxy-L-arabinose transferase-like glycosyltransferase